MSGESFIQPDKSCGEHLFTHEQLGLSSKRFIAGTDQLATSWIHGYSEIIFCECGPAEGFPSFHSSILICQHKKKSAEKSTIFQVMDLLEIKFSDATRRWAELVAAHSAGYIPAMMAIGATAEEIQRVCALDRSARGVSAQQEYLAEIAIESRKVSERLVVIPLPHNKWSTVTDRLFGKLDQLLILSSEQKEAYFYGELAKCDALFEQFQGEKSELAYGYAENYGCWTAKIQISQFDDVRRLVYRQIQADKKIEKTLGTSSLTFLFLY